MPETRYVWQCQGGKEGKERIVWRSALRQQAAVCLSPDPARFPAHSSYSLPWPVWTPPGLKQPHQLQPNNPPQCLTTPPLPPQQHVPNRRNQHHQHRQPGSLVLTLP